jgi:hypothetical protein
VANGTAHFAKVFLNRFHLVCVARTRYVLIGVWRYRIILFYELDSFIVLGSLFELFKIIALYFGSYGFDTKLHHFQK